MKIEINEQPVELELYMAIGGGYGQYKICANFALFGKSEIVCFHSTDSELYDDYKGKTEGIEARLLAVIEVRLIEYIECLIIEKEWETI